MAKLASYRAKRDFKKTSEPRGQETRGKEGRASGLNFVVQEHDATRLHYDLRLELDGTLKSWAVTKGPSLIAGEKRLAVHVEDHPLDYATFEGTIPKDEYGGGTVLLWDRGRWQPEGDPRQGYAKGHLAFRLEGEKLHGAWHLVRMRRKPRERQESWLLIKSDDEHARAPDDPDILDEAPLSVKTGRSLEEIAGGAAPVKDAARKPKPTKATATRSEGSRSKVKSEASARVRSGPMAPMPTDIQPCLATLVDEAPEGSQWLHEIKWDGYRLIAFLDRAKARLKSRNGLDWSKRFPGIASAVAALPVTSAILDGEAVMEDESGTSSFSRLQQALSRTTEGVAANAVFHAFDLLYLDGEDLRPLPLEERKARLAGLLAEAPEGAVLRLSEHLDADGPAMLRNACRMGLEGVISKRRDLPYRSGRNADWVKIKCSERQEFVIAGFVPSTAVKKAVGSLVLGLYDKDRLVYAGRTGTGFTADIARDLFKRLEALRITEPAFGKLTADQRRGVVWVKPELVAEVEFRGWTADRVVRHAAFKGLREDKSARDVVREKPRMPSARIPAATGTRSGGGTVEVAGVRLTHPDRVLWEEQGVTKQGLAEFYLQVADWLLPHVVDRPLSLVRCPSGSQKGCFFQKHSWAGLADTVLRKTVGDEEVLFVRDIKGIVALVQAGVLEFHAWGAAIGDIERPDRITFDFDPGDGVPWPDVIEGARDLRERLRALGLESFPKTTGGKGLHVVVPLTPKAGWEEVKDFARAVSAAMEADAPSRYLAKATKSARRGKIFVDYLRNARGATAIAAYSTRARPGAPVATPLGWDELSAAMKSDHFTVANLPARLDALRSDPWEQLFKVRQGLPEQKSRPAKRRR
jgi:bifunctional non-homologous end joining protein LigD